MNARILVFGKDGQLGQSLLRSLPAVAEVHAVGRETCDLKDSRAILNQIDAIEPALIINAAAYTAVDRAESDSINALLVNAKAPQTMARAARRMGVPLIHFSTDYVFDGTKLGCYAETDMPRPINAYGMSKYKGESYVLNECSRSLVFRTSWVFSAHGQNFLNTMLRLASERDQLRIVADQEGTPTSAEWLAQVTTQISEQLIKGGQEFPYGLYHLSAGGATTWHGYTQYLLSEAISRGYVGKVKPSEVVPISTAEYPTPAKRPSNSKLDCTLFRQAFPGIDYPCWQDLVRDVLDSKFDIKKALN